MDSRPSTGESASISSSDEDQVDHVCDAFEQCWKAGETPALEDYLKDVDETTQQMLLPELIGLELDYRQQRNESPAAEEYRRRFSQHRSIVDDVFKNRQENQGDKAVENHGPGAFGGGEEPKDPLLAVTTPMPVADQRFESDGLRVRCPNCREAIQLVVHTSWSDITCNLCGSQFSLVDSPRGAAPERGVSRMAHFELISQLGAGSFGTVWEARDTTLDRRVAVKIPRKGQLDTLQAEQFLREARATAQLSHPNIVSVHEVGQEDGTVYIVSDLVRGMTLSEWLRDQRPTFHESVELCVTMADALHHAHTAGVVHRDLKPSNVMLDEVGEPHVMDFGLAKREAGEITMTVDGQILGTPAYMSPEQARGEGHWSDRRSDVYSLGVILFELLTGERPFRGTNRVTLISQVLLDDPPSPRKLDARIPRDLETICLKCLEKDPNRRYPSAQSLAHELRRYLHGEPIQARPLGRIARGGRWCKRKPMAATVVALVTLIAVVSPPLAIWERWQRNRIAALGIERGDLIDRLVTQSNELQEELQEAKLDWDHFAPQFNKAQSPRTHLLQLAQDHHRSIVANMQNKPADLQQRVHTYLGLATVVEALGKTEEAIQLFEQAGTMLSELAEQHPTDMRYQEALGKCYLHLGTLKHLTENSKDAVAAGQQSVQIRKGLVADHPSRANYSVDLRDAYAQLGLWQRAGGDTGVGTHSIEKAFKATEKLDANWPKEPMLLHRLACKLAGSEPILVEASSQQPTANPSPP